MPEPITSRLFPITSLKISDNTLAGYAAVAKLAALDGGQMLANRVDLVNRSSTSEEQSCRLLLVSKRDASAGKWQQSRRPARQAANDQILALLQLSAMARISWAAATPRSSGTGWLHSRSRIRFYVAQGARP